MSRPPCPLQSRIFNVYLGYNASHARPAIARILVESEADVKTGSLDRLSGSGDLFAFYASYPSQQLFSVTSVGNPFFQTVDTDHGDLHCACEVRPSLGAVDPGASTNAIGIAIPEWNRE